jgi:hypothetical protein
LVVGERSSCIDCDTVRSSMSRGSIRGRSPPSILFNRWLAPFSRGYSGWSM